MSAVGSGERGSVGARGEGPVRQRVLPVWGHHHKNRLLRYVSCGEWREGSIGARGEGPVRQRVLPVWGHHKNRLLRYVSCGEWRGGL